MSPSKPSIGALLNAIIALTNAPGTVIPWQDLDRALANVRARQRIQFVGLSGAFRFDASRRREAGQMRYFTIQDHAFVEAAFSSDFELCNLGICSAVMDIQ
jgi:hypothetical protein